ncbi:MAG: outer membrane protein assembly factor BamD, partial [Gammaproteobacteria bacterium]
FDDLQVKYPFGDYAQQGELEKAYAHFKLGEFSNTDEILQRFIRVYPRHPHIEYAYYLRALNRYTQGIGKRGTVFKVEKTQRTNEYARQAFDYFSLLIRRFPHSRYRADSVKRLKVLRDALAEHDLYIANYYLQRKAYVAAARRAKNLLETYPQSVQIPAALSIMVQSYEGLGLHDLARDSQRVLDLNFPQFTPKKFKPGKKKS